MNVTEVTDGGSAKANMKNTTSPSNLGAVVSVRGSVVDNRNLSGLGAQYATSDRTYEHAVIFREPDVNFLLEQRSQSHGDVLSNGSSNLLRYPEPHAGFEITY